MNPPTEKGNFVFPHDRYFEQEIREKYMINEPHLKKIVFSFRELLYFFSFP